MQVIPITDAMREPRKFPAVLTGVMMGLLGKQWIPSSSLICLTPFILQVLFGGAGVLAYLTFGDKVQTVVLVNLDGESKMVQAVRIPLPAHVLPSLIHPPQPNPGPIPLLPRHTPLSPAPALPSRADNGKRPIHKQRESRRARQMAEERIQVLRGHALHGYQLGGRCGPG